MKYFHMQINMSLCDSRRALSYFQYQSFFANKCTPY
jgi:hypothetical protein